MENIFTIFDNKSDSAGLKVFLNCQNGFHRKHFYSFDNKSGSAYLKVFPNCQNGFHRKHFLKIDNKSVLNISRHQKTPDFSDALYHDLH